MIENIKRIIKENHPTYDELVSFFDVEKNVINEYLLLLEQDGLIEKVKNRYYLTSELNLIPAVIISIKEKFAFANVSEDEDLYISINNLKNAFLDDKVLLKKISSFGEKDEYEVVKVTKRARSILVGEVVVFGSTKVLKVDKIARPDFLFLINSDLQIKNHQIVEAKIKKISSSSSVVEVINILGHKNDIGMDVTRIILFNNAPLEFNEDVINEVKNIPSEVKKNDYKNREDYRDHLIVTIDGDDAKDFDDAVEVSKVDDIYYVGVHIADVSYYVKENSPLDK